MLGLNRGSWHQMKIIDLRGMYVSMYVCVHAHTAANAIRKQHKTWLYILSQAEIYNQFMKIPLSGKQFWERECI